MKLTKEESKTLKELEIKELSFKQQVIVVASCILFIIFGTLIITSFLK